jgi:hypothetical protein
VATHFSRLLRHAWVTVGLFLFPGHHTGNITPLGPKLLEQTLTSETEKQSRMKMNLLSQYQEQVWIVVTKYVEDKIIQV